MLFKEDGSKGLFMKKSGKIIPFLLVAVTGCTNMLSTTPLPGSNISSEINNSFSEKALEQSYLSRKFNSFLNPVNEPKIYNELRYGAYKHPELVKDVVNMDAGILDIINPLAAVSTFRAASPAFASFMEYLEQPANQINTFAGNGFTEPGFYGDRTIGGYGGDDGQADEASFNQPWQMAFDASDNMYISDYLNNRIRRIDKATGIITTIAGDGNANNTGDGFPAINAEINTPGPLIFDKSWNLFIISEQGNQVRKISAVNGKLTPGSIISTVAGAGTYGYSPDGTKAGDAAFIFPWGLTFDHSGNLLLSDTYNHVVRKISAVNGEVGPDSVITTIAGIVNQAGFNGDGKTGTETTLNAPNELLFDQSGNLYITDYLNYSIRKLVAVNGEITPESKIFTVAGDGTFGDTVDVPASQSKLGDTGGMVFDHSGRLVFSDYGNHKIRVIDEKGIIHTLAGTGDHAPDAQHIGSYGGDGGPAGDAALYQPDGIAIDKLGNIYVGDACNHRIRKINK
jgi:hypothetical protein